MWWHWVGGGELLRSLKPQAKDSVNMKKGYVEDDGLLPAVRQLSRNCEWQLAGDCSLAKQCKSVFEIKLLVTDV
jgi:hypothetical protein